MVKVVFVLLVLFLLALARGLCVAASWADDKMEEFMRTIGFQALGEEELDDEEIN